MAFFNKQQANTAKKDTKEKVGKSEPLESNVVYAKTILLKPRVTEKAMINTQDGVYVFNIAPKANKKEVINEIRRIYKVTPRKVSTVQVPKKRTFLRGVRGVKGGGKKAYVYLKKGDKIDLM